MTDWEAIKTALIEIDRDQFAVGEPFDRLIAPLVSDALSLDRGSLALLLMSAHNDVLVVAQELIHRAADRDAVRVAEALLTSDSYWSSKPLSATLLDEVLRRAFPQLSPFLRRWAAERPGVHGPLGLHPGVDYTPPPKLEDWPKGRPLPPPGTALGVRARLARQDFAVGPFIDEWNDEVVWALKKFQYERMLEPTGELDEATVECLCEGDGDP